MMAKNHFIILFIGLESVELYFFFNLKFYFCPVVNLSPSYHLNIDLILLAFC